MTTNVHKGGKTAKEGDVQDKGHELLTEEYRRIAAEQARVVVREALKEVVTYDELEKRLRQQTTDTLAGVQAVLSASQEEMRKMLSSVDIHLRNIEKATSTSANDMKLAAAKVTEALEARKDMQSEQAQRIDNLEEDVEELRSAMSNIQHESRALRREIIGDPADPEYYSIRKALKEQREDAQRRQHELLTEIEKSGQTVNRIVERVEVVEDWVQRRREIERQLVAYTKQGASTAWRWLNTRRGIVAAIGTVSLLALSNPDVSQAVVNGINALIKFLEGTP